MRCREDGSATVEAVLIIPVFLIMLGLLIDATYVFKGQTKVLRVVQDANRNMSIGRLRTEAEVEAYINARLALMNITPSITDAQSDTNVVITTVTVPAAQFQMLGYFTGLVNLQLEMREAHLLESYDPATLSPTTTTTAPPVYGS